MDSTAFSDAKVANGCVKSGCPTVGWKTSGLVLTTGKGGSVEVEVAPTVSVVTVIITFWVAVAMGGLWPVGGIARVIECLGVWSLEIAVPLWLVLL